MTKCINYFLCYENLATYGTMLTLGKTGCGTSRSYRCVNYFGMTECCYSIECTFKLFTASTAIYNAVIRSFDFAGCIYHIFLYGRSISMAISSLTCCHS